MDLAQALQRGEVICEKCQEPQLHARVAGLESTGFKFGV